MRQANTRGRPGAHRGRGGTAAAPLLLAAGSLLLGACSGDGSETAAQPEVTASTTTSQSASASASASVSLSPSPTSTPTPQKPAEPRFAPGPKGKRSFAEYVVDGWGYGLQTNDPSVLLDASGPKPCRGCDTYRAELRQRTKEKWYVQFPGATVRTVTFRADGPVQVGRVVVDIPASQSFFEDGTFRNDNRASKGATFLIDIRVDGRGERRRWRLLAFSIS